MIKTLLSVINVEEGEETPALLLLGYGFFMGVFLATFKVVAETLFLKTMAESLREAIFVSGLLGVMSTWLYSFMQNRIGFAKLALFNLFAVFGFIGYLYLNISAASDPTLIYVLYVMLFPITSIMLLTFWGMFGRIFNLRQSKRIIGGIDAGQLIATIIAFLTVPLLINLLGSVDRILMISTLSIIICMIIFMLIIRHFKVGMEQVERTDESRRGLTLVKLFRYKYAIFLAIFIAVSIVTFSVVDYIFLTITEQQYQDETSLANFLSYMYLSIMGATLLMQTFVNDKLIATWGLKTALMILPVVLGIFTIGSLLTGTLLGYQISSVAFFWFFLFIVFSKFFSHMIREALEVPTFKLFFMPLDVKIRFDVQAKVEGVINEFSRLIAGSIILGLGFLTFFELIHYNYFLLVVIVGYFLVTGRLYNQYRANVKLRLENKDELSDQEEAEEEELELVLKKANEISEPDQFIFAYKLVEKLDYGLVRDSLNNLIVHPNKQIKKFGLEKLNEQRRIAGVSNSNRTISLSESGGNGHEGLDQWLNRLQYATESNPEVENVSFLSRSENTDDRIHALNLISNDPVDEVIPFLIDLLNDIDYNVRITAIQISGGINKPEFYPFLIENLSSSTYGDQTSYALAKQGDEILSYLEVSFHKTGQDQQTQIRIMKIYENIGTERAMELLWSKVDYPDRKIVTQVLASLANMDFQAKGYQAVRIKYVIESDINNLIWNLNALDKIHSSETNDLVIASIHEENEYNYNHIYMLLSMIFDRSSIRLVKENIESKTNEGVTYAIELLDVILTEDIKDRVIPLLDDIPDQDKVRKLNVFYPHLITDFKEVIKQIINKEYNQINRWTKILALYYVGKEKIQGLNLELISNLFNPDRQLSETSAWALYQVDQQVYEENIERLPSEMVDDYNGMIIDSQIQRTGMFHKHPAIEKIFFIRKINLFKNLPGNLITSLVDFAEELFCYKGHPIILDHDNIRYFYIVYDGIINIIQNGIVIDSLTRYGFLGEMAEEKNKEKYLSILPITTTVLYRIEKDRFYDVMSSDHDMAKSILRNILDVPEPVESEYAITA
ncbi:HEAT repeat domain-containing protein [Bacteroidota bacterium]